MTRIPVSAERGVSPRRPQDASSEAVLARLRSRDLSSLVRNRHLELPPSIARLPAAVELARSIDSELSRDPPGQQPGVSASLSLANSFAKTFAAGAATRPPRLAEAWQALLEHVDTLPPRPERPATWFPPASHRTGWSPELTRFALDEHRRSRPPVPLVTRIREAHGTPGSYRRVGLIASQHLYDSTAQMFGELQVLGLSPQHGAILGKSYSGSPVVRADLASAGFEVDNLDFFEGLPGVDRSEWPERYRSVPNPINKRQFALHEMRGRVARGELDAIQFVDDGADLILALAEQYPELSARTTAVEQTRFGARRLRKTPPPFPVVNVAESAVKLSMESVLIGWSIAEEMSRTIDELAAQGIPRGREVVVFGYGAVGRTSALLLQEKGFAVHVVDPSKEARAQAERDGLRATRTADGSLARADYVLGTTGFTSMKAEEFRRLKDGAVLFSGSSSTVEFACTGDGVRTEDHPGTEATFRGRPVRLYSQASPELPHEIVSCEGKRFLLAKGGTPINLTADPDPIPAELIQLTRGLLLLGLLQAGRLPHGTSGLVDLDPRGQLDLARSFMTEVVRPQPQLLSPRARALLEEGYARVVSELEPAVAAQPTEAATPPDDHSQFEPRVEHNALDPSPQLVAWKKKLGRMLEGLEAFDGAALSAELRALPPRARQDALRVARDLDPSLSFCVAAEDPLEELVGLAQGGGTHRVVAEPHEIFKTTSHQLQVGEMVVEVDCAGSPQEALENARESVRFAEGLYKQRVEVTGLDGISTTRATVRGKDAQAVRAVVRRLEDWIEAAGLPARNTSEAPAAPPAPSESVTPDREGRGWMSRLKHLHLSNHAVQQPTEERYRDVRNDALATLIALQKDWGEAGAAVRAIGEALLQAGYTLQIGRGSGRPCLQFQKRQTPRRNHAYRMPLSRTPMDPVVFSQIGRGRDDGLYCSLEEFDEPARAVIAKAAREHGVKIKWV